MQYRSNPDRAKAALIVMCMIACTAVALRFLAGCSLVRVPHNGVPIACGCYACENFEYIGRDPKCAFGPCAHTTYPNDAGVP